MDTLDGSAGNQIGNFAVGGTTAISAASPVTFAINTTSAGTLTATATETAAPTPNTDNITVDAGISVESTGDVVFFAGDDIIIDATADVLAPAGNIDFRTGFGDNDNEGIMTIDGTVSASATVALNVASTNSALPAGTAIVAEGATGTISASGLLLLNTSAGATGAFNLNASATNTVQTIAATTQAAINFADSSDFDCRIGDIAQRRRHQLRHPHEQSRCQHSGGRNDYHFQRIERRYGLGHARLDRRRHHEDPCGDRRCRRSRHFDRGGRRRHQSGSGNDDPRTAGITATTTNAPITITSVSQLAVDNINAGTGDVTLHVTNANTATSSITSLHPNDDTADVTGHTVTLTADGEFLRQHRPDWLLHRGGPVPRGGGDDAECQH